MGISLTKILQEIQEESEKNVLNSHPQPDSIKKFHEVSERLMKILKNSKVIDKSQFYNTEEGTSMFKPSVVARGDMKQYIGEYNGDDFKSFTQSLAKLYEKSGFKIEEGYGIDNVKGFEVKNDDGEVVGEVDFLEKDSIPNYGDMVIIKHKKQ